MTGYRYRESFNTSVSENKLKECAGAWMENWEWQTKWKMKR